MTSYQAADSDSPSQRQKYPRVAKVIGPGPYRNSKGASCVALVQHAGLNIHPGTAANIPSAAKKAGYQVDHNPESGAVFVTSESSAGTKSGHTGIILDASDQNYVYVREQNYRSGMLTEGWILKSNILFVVHVN